MIKSKKERERSSEKEERFFFLVRETDGRKDILWRCNYVSSVDIKEKWMCVFICLHFYSVHAHIVVNEKYESSLKSWTLWETDLSAFKRKVK